LTGRRKRSGLGRSMGRGRRGSGKDYKRKTKSEKRKMKSDASLC